MSNRPKLSNVWASNSLEITNPDLDSAHPSGRGGVGKYTLGWIEPPIKQPHQWRNYVDNKIDLLLVEFAENGGFLYRDNITYKKGARVFENGVCYVSLIDNNINNPVNSSAWEVVAENFLEVNRIITDSTNKTNSHTASRNNPHNLTVSQIGGITKVVIDALVETDFQEFLTHDNNTQNPHNVTAQQIGTLPITGGVWPNEVNYKTARFRGYLLQSESPITGSFTGFLGTEILGVSYSGEPVTGSNNDKEVILSTGNYINIEIKNGKEYRLPKPYAFVNFRDSLNSMEVGSYILEFTDPTNADIPTMDGGLLLNSDYNLTIDKIYKDVTVVVEKESGTSVIDETLSKHNLKDYLGVTGKALSIKIFKSLTDKQKAML